MLGGRGAVALMTMIASLAVGGCAVDKGSALADQFEEDWAGTEDVMDAYATFSNSLPFVGSADGTLVLADDVSEERVEELVHELGEYEAEHDGVNGSLKIGESLLGVANTREGNEALIDWWRVVRADPEVATYTVEDDGSGGAKVSLVVTDAERVDEVFEDLVDGGGAYPVLDGEGDVRVEDPESAFVIDTLPGDVGEWDRAIAAYRAVEERYDVTRLTIDYRCVIGVAEGVPVEEARQVAEAAAPGLTDLTVKTAW